MSKGNITRVEMDSSDSTPIIITIEENRMMGKFDLVIVVGNFSTEHSAKSAGNGIARMVERELGFRKSKPARPN